MKINFYIWTREWMLHFKILTHILALIFLRKEFFFLQSEEKFAKMKVPWLSNSSASPVAVFQMSFLLGWSDKSVFYLAVFVCERFWKPIGVIEFGQLYGAVFINLVLCCRVIKQMQPETWGGEQWLLLCFQEIRAACSLMSQWRFESALPAALSE